MDRGGAHSQAVPAGLYNLCPKLVSAVCGTIEVFLKVLSSLSQTWNNHIIITKGNMFSKVGLRFVQSKHKGGWGDLGKVEQKSTEQKKKFKK